MINIKIVHNGNMANKMFQYMYTRKLQEMIGESYLFGFEFPMFGLNSADNHLPGRLLHIKDGHRHCLSSLAYLLNNKSYDSLLFGGYVQRMEYYNSAMLCNILFPPRVEIDNSWLGDSFITINVRGGEILRNMHRDYGPVPVNFFEQVANRTKLEPVLMGQIGNDSYSKQILNVFSGCKIIPSISPGHDFEILRNSSNIAMSVSSFSWLGSWLSFNAQSIHMPVSGFLNPRQRPDINLVPVNDKRYTFYHFPVQHWIASQDQIDSLFSNDYKYDEITKSKICQIVEY